VLAYRLAVPSQVPVVFLVSPLPAKPTGDADLMQRPVRRPTAAHCVPLFRLLSHHRLHCTNLAEHFHHGFPDAILLESISPPTGADAECHFVKFPRECEVPRPPLQVASVLLAPTKPLAPARRVLFLKRLPRCASPRGAACEFPPPVARGVPPRDSTHRTVHLEQVFEKLARLAFDHRERPGRAEHNVGKVAQRGGGLGDLAQAAIESHVVDLGIQVSRYQESKSECCYDDRLRL
jgi:hypothetical protein